MDGPPESDCCSVCHGSFNLPCQANCSHWFCCNCILLVWYHGSTLQACRCPLCRRAITLLVPDEASLQRRQEPEVAEVLGKVETYNRQFGENTNGLIQRLQDLPFLLRRLLRELMDPRRSLPFVIRARVYIAPLLVELGPPRIVKNRNRVPETYSINNGQCPRSPKISLFPSLPNMSPKKVSAAHNVYVSPLRSSKMILSAVYVLSPVDIIPEGILGVVGLLDDVIIVLICFLHVAALYRSVLLFRFRGP